MYEPWKQFCIFEVRGWIFGINYFIKIVDHCLTAWFTLHVLKTIAGRLYCVPSNFWLESTTFIHINYFIFVNTFIELCMEIFSMWSLGQCKFFRRAIIMPNFWLCYNRNYNLNTFQKYICSNWSGKYTF